MQVYSNQTIPVPQAEWYATMQLNYYTNNIKLNDRFIFNVVDLDDRENNQAYKVKAIIKSTGEHTFVKNNTAALEDTPTIIIALDKDMIHPDDNIETRIAESAPIYTTVVEPAYEYFIVSNDDNQERILLTDTQSYEFNLYYNSEIVENIDFTFTAKLNGVESTLWDNYFVLTKTGINTFTVHNKKSCTSGTLEITITCDDPSGETTSITGTYEIELGGFY